MYNHCGNQCKHADRRGNNKEQFICNENSCSRATKEQSRLANPFECTSTCCDENFRKTSDEKNVCFKVEVIDECSQCSVGEPNSRDLQGICLCCREGKLPEPSKTVVKSVLVYDFPEPKFDDLTISKRDFVPKPITNRGLPPWHPTCKDRWHPLNAPSVRETIYKRDYTPPIVSPRKGSTESSIQYRYLTEDDFDNENGSHKQHDEAVQYPVWRKTTTGPCEPIEVCSKSLQPIWGTEVHKSPEENESYRAEEVEHNPEQLHLHGPDCEKHCYSTPLRCHDRQDSKDRIRPSSSRVELAAMTMEKNHFQHEGRNVGFSTEVCHVEPVSESKFNYVERRAEKSPNSEECGDCKDKHCCKKVNSCIEPNIYCTSRDGFQNSHPAHKTESYNNESADRTSNSDENGFEEKAMLCSECDYPSRKNYPMNPEESSAHHYTESTQFQFKCECDHSFKDSHPRREASRIASFEEDSSHSSDCSRSKTSDNSNIHHCETPGRGVVLGPSMLGHTHDEVVGHVAVPLCTAKPRELSFEEVRQNNNHHCSKDNYLKHNSKYRNISVNQKPGHSGTEVRNDPSLCNQFTVCEGKNLNHVKWWKLGGGANGERSNDCNDVPNGRMKSLRPI